MAARATRRFRDKVKVSPDDVKDADAFSVKIVAVAGFANDWAAYEGPTDRTDQQIASNGVKISKAAAEALFWVMARSGRRYRG